MRNKNIVSAYIEQFRQDRQKQLKLGIILAALAVLVAGLVFWQLHNTGIAMTNEVFCGQEEHIHDESCYTPELICGQEESEGHTHTASCYQTEKLLVCTDTSADHVHTDACYETVEVLTCGLEESPGHTHTDSCYEMVLTCQIPEHVHTVECLIDESADVETAAEWEATLPEELSGVWSDDVIAVAQSQIGYTESENNFRLADDGETRQGYTRYGAWYGNDYGDWDAMFAAFCLYYAGVGSDVIPYDSGSYAWTVELNDAGLYADVASYIPAPGDLVFFDDDQDGRADRVAIVEEPVVETNEDAGTMTLTALYVIEGNSEDAVEENEYELSEVCILGYGLMPEQEDLDEILDAIAAGESVGNTPARNQTSNSEDEVQDEATEDDSNLILGEDEVSTVLSSSSESEDTPFGYILSTEGALTGRAVTSSTNDVVPFADDHNGDIIFGDIVIGTATYDPETGEYTASFDITFEVNSNDLGEDEEGVVDECWFYLPEGVTVPVIYQTGEYEGYVSGTTTVGFMFHFEYDATAGKWKVIIDFEDDYVDRGEEWCEIHFNVSVSADLLDEDGKLHFDFGDNVDRTTDIESSDGKTSTADIEAKKTAGEYNAADNSITYTITISSEKGTNAAVSFEDTLTLKDLALDTVSLDGVTLNGVSLTGYTLSFVNNYDGTYTIKVSPDLPEMSAGDTYKITYTVYLEDIEGYEMDGSAGNTIVGKSADEWGHELESTDTSNNVTVKKSLLAKTGWYDGVDEIHWTITVNDGGMNDIANWTLYDDSFADLSESDITVSGDNLYEFVYEDGKIVGIKFLPDSDGTNRTSYTITYTTNVENDETLGNTTPEYNDVWIDDNEGKTQKDVEVGTDVTGGSLDKSFEGSTRSEDGDTVEIHWSSSITVPAGGIKSGTVITDTLTGDQWYTYEQIMELYNNVFSQDLIFKCITGYEWNGQTNQNEPVYYKETITVPASDYTFYAIDESGNRVAVSDLEEGVNYVGWEIVFNDGIENVDFSQYEDDGAYEWTFTFGYSSTGDISNLTSDGITTKQFINTIVCGALSDNAIDTETVGVVKTDADGNVGSSDVVLGDDGTLTFVIKIYVPSGYTGTFTVADELPNNVTLNSFKAVTDYNNWEIVYEKDSNGNWTGTYQDSSDGWKDKTSTVYVQQATGDDGNTYDASFTYEVPTHLTDGLTGSGGYVTITYTVLLTEEEQAEIQTAITNGERVAYTNTVRVTYNGEIYGETELTENVGEKEDNTPGKIVSKAVEYDGSYTSKMLSYSVVLNPDGDDLLTEGNELEFIDEITWMDQSASLYLSLDPTTVHFYQIAKLTSVGGGMYSYTDADGNTQIVEYDPENDEFYEDEEGHLFIKIGELDIDWTLDTSGYYKIDAMVPDETPILVQYVYVVHWREDVDEGTTVNLTNSATLKGDVDITDSDQKYDYVGDTSIGGELTVEGLVLHKVETGSYGTVLAGATFTLYRYDSTTGYWEELPLELVSDENGSITIDSKTMTVENEDGTVTNYFQYNTAYYLVEKGSPEGYVTDSRLIYFYWSDSDTTTYPEHYPDGFTTDAKYNATDLSSYQMDYYWTNNLAPDEEVEVVKKWVMTDGNGNEVPLTDEEKAELSATVQLYYYLSSKVPEGWGDKDLPTSGENPNSGSAAPTVQIKTSWAGTTTDASQELEVGDTVTITITDISGWGAIIDSYTLTINGVEIIADEYGTEGVTVERTYYDGGYLLKSLTYTISGDLVKQGAEIILENDNQSNETQLTFEISVTHAETSDPEPEPDEKEIILEWGVYSDAHGTSYTYVLDESNDWTAMVDDLPEYWFDEDGNLWWYYYYFQEIDHSDGWTTSSIDPEFPLFEYNSEDGTYTLVSGTGVDGIEEDKDTVTITNTKTTDKGYELPSAGGPGTGILIAAGLACAGGAGVLLIRNVHHSRVPYRKRRGRP